MYTVKANVAKNRLYVSMIGFFQADEMKACTDQVILETKKLKPGYDVITDVSQFKPAGPDAIKEIERGQAHFKATKIGHGIRVVGGSATTSLQFARTGKSVGYVPDTVSTVVEAEKILDNA